MQGPALRSLKVNELSGLLGKFDISYKEVFKQKISENGQAATTYDSILTNRNKVAHGKGSNATFEDVKIYYKKSHVILDYFKEALRVD